MAIDWYDVRAPPIEAVEHGVAVAADDGFLEATATGPRSYDRIDYPFGQVLPEDTRRTDGNEFTHTVSALLFFERGRGVDYLDDVLHPTAAVIDETLAALSSTECVVTYVPTAIEDFAGELDDTQLILVRIEFSITTLVDLAET
jgi:hypothetical protein